MQKPIVWPTVDLSLPRCQPHASFHSLHGTKKDAREIARIAEFNRALLEGTALAWTLVPEQIIEKLKDRDYAFYGVSVDKSLAGFGLVRAIQKDHIVEGALLCTDPIYRNHGIAQELVFHVTEVVDQTSAILFFADAVAFHCGSQKALEYAGCLPIGFLPHFETFGASSTSPGTPETLVRYVRFPQRDCSRWLSEMRTAKLSAASQKLLNTIRMLFEDSGQDLLGQTQMEQKKAG